MLVEALGTTAHGSAFLFIDAIDPRGTVNAGVYERIGRVFKETARYEAFLGGSPVEDVAIYYSDDSRVLPGDNGCPTPDVIPRQAELPHLNAVTGVATQLQRVHIPFGVITRSGLGHLSEYRVVLLPDVLRMDEEELRAFRAYVEGGDTFIVVGVRHCQVPMARVEPISGWPMSLAPTSRPVSSGAAFTFVPVAHSSWKRCSRRCISGTGSRPPDRTEAHEPNWAFPGSPMSTRERRWPH